MGKNTLEWGKGLFRLWLVASLFWIGFVFILFFEHLEDTIGGVALIVLYAGLIPSVIVLIVGKLILWALQGFKK